MLSTRSKDKDTYYLPGGKREAGETDAEALIREIEEELAVQLDPDSLVFFGAFRAQAHSHPEGIMINMRCYTASYTGTIQASAEIEEVVWLNYADKERVSPVDKIIFDELKKKELLR